MNTYRQDLEAARFQIDQLREQLVDKDETITRLRHSPSPAPPPISEERSESATSDESDAAPARKPPSWWHVLPAVSLIGLGGTYVALYGVAMPSDQWSSMIALGGLGAAFMSIVSALRACSGGESSVGQRLLTIAAGVSAAPLVIAVGFLALPVLGVIVGAGSLLVGAYHALVALRDWIKGE